MSEPETIRVNFARPMPIFPLRSVALLPHAVVTLFIFEPRYRQMVQHVLDGTGQIAMATFEGDEWKAQYEGQPPIRPAVCVGQIVRHEQNADGTYRIWLQGVCRATVAEEMPVGAVETAGEHAGDEILYRRAMLEPSDEESATESELAYVREDLEELLRWDPLAEVEQVRAAMEQLAKHEGELPTSVVLDLLGLTLASMTEDTELRYRMLREGDPLRRAKLLTREFGTIASTLDIADRQYDPEAPKGVSWN
jgi:Lon protease-like protein